MQHIKVVNSDIYQCSSCHWPINHIELDLQWLNWRHVHYRL